MDEVPISEMPAVSVQKRRRGRRDANCRHGDQYDDEAPARRPGATCQFRRMNELAYRKEVAALRVPTADDVLVDDGRYVRRPQPVSELDDVTVTDERIVGEVDASETRLHLHRKILGGDGRKPVTVDV